MEGISLQKILLVDDEPDILSISRIALETVGGYEVCTCDSGPEMLRRLPAFDPDLVMIDVLMPEMAGLEVLQHMRAISGFRDTPVVFLTGVINGDDLQALRAAGAADVILKPFDPMTLADRIRRIWTSVDEQ